MKKWLYLFLLISGSAFANDFRFTHLTIDDGLSENMCQDVIVDSKGFLWKAGFYFLDKFNGYEFDVYKVGDIQKNFVGNRINGLFIDRGDNLWVLTDKGVLRYSYEFDSFDHISFHNTGNLIADDPKGRLWALSNNQIVIIDPAKVDGVVLTGINAGRCYSICNSGDDMLLVRANDILIVNIHTYEQNTITPLGQNHQFYSNLSIDDKGHLWTFDQNNLYQINSLTLNYRTHPLKHSLTELMCSTGSMLFKGDAEIWITSHAGAAVYNLITEEMNFLHHDPDRPYSIASDFIIASVLDNNDIVWLATHQYGISYYDYHKKPFYHLSRIPYYDNSLISNIVYAMDIDHQDMLWIGTEEGLDCYDPKTGRFTHHKLDKDNKRIDLLVSDNKGSIYLCGRNDDFLTLYDPKSGVTSSHKFPVRGVARSMYINDFNELIITLVNSPEPMLFFDIGKKIFLPVDIQGINKNIFNIYHLHEDTDGLIWLGVDDGCVIYNGLEQRFRFIPLKLKDQDTIVTGCYIHYIFEDSRQRIWLASAHGIFCLVDKENFDFIHLNSKNGLPTDVVKSIQEDKEGNLWMATDKGICKFDPSTFDYRVYSNSDGVFGLNFEHFAIGGFSNGDMVFGGNNGLTIFSPSRIIDNPIPPKITLTKLQISNNEVKTGDVFNGRVVLERLLSETQKICLSYLERNISIEYAAIQFSFLAQNKYAYKLEGFEDNWNYVDRKREAVYTNLPFGSYVFLVKAANKDGLWNETPIRLEIEVSPPWWRSTPAYIAYAFLFCCISLIAAKIILYQRRLRDTIRMEKLEKQKEHELSQMKLSFFTDISHEFKTPLTLIIGPLDQVINEAGLSHKIKNKLVRVQQNSKRLLRLINQLIDFRKMEQNVFRLATTNFDIISITRNVVNSFKDLADSGNISIYYKHSYEKCFVNLDLCQYENVLYNLLSNAIKYNKPGGHVVVSVEQSSSADNISLTVEDTGIGISEEDRQNIFERFSDKSNKPLFQFQKSSGLGLYLTKSIVELHKGEIYVESELGKGTKLTILWPALNKHQISSTLSEIERINTLEIEQSGMAPSLPDKNSPLIMIVEDNKELREYIRSLLWDQYRIEEAENGKMAQEIIFQQPPDLIITDVMMPVMDGIALCKALRVNILTSHIPIIVLSAKNDLDTKLRGYELGIEGYVEKPFEPELLLTRLRCVFNRRKMLKGYFSQPDGEVQNLDDLSVMDKSFIEKLDGIIEENISEPEFGVEVMRNKLGLTKLQLYAKLDALTGLTPKDYIRQKRLARASVLIREGSLNFSEIAYSVGFTAPSNFNRAFKSFFGLSPSQYRKKGK